MKRWILTVAAMSVVGSASARALATFPLADFDDATFQGWISIPDPRSGTPFGGTLEVVPTGGNPGGYMRATDTTLGGGLLFVSGSPEFQGDLSIYSELRWDEFVFDSPSAIIQGTSPVLIGPDGMTLWGIPSPAGAIDEWVPRSALLIESAWTLLPGPGTLSFEETLANGIVGFEMTANEGLGFETGLDNITLIPEPSSLLLATLGVLAISRRRR